MSLSLVVDERLCTSSGLCEAAAPDLFEIGDDGAMRVLADPVPEDREGPAGEAARGCPTRALRLVARGD